MKRIYTVTRVIDLPGANTECWVLISWPSDKDQFASFGSNGGRIVHSTDSKEKATAEAHRFILEGSTR